MTRKTFPQAGDNAVSPSVRGEILKVYDDQGMQLIDVDLYTGETFTRIELGHPYGFASNPLPGAEVIVHFPSAARSHPFAMLAPDRRHRKRNLAPGELALWDDKGQFLHMTEAGDTAIETAGTVTIKANRIVFDAGEILLGGADADKAVGMLGSLDIAGHELVSALSTVVKTK
ncbi:MAG: phage baseplate assembly protein [Pseudomonadota bacterium]